MSAKKVLVTGVSGYIASWVVKHLLDRGYTVHGTVRSLQNQEKVSHLMSLAEGSHGILKLFEADLLEPGSFAKAMEGCEYVIHTASPFFVAGVKDPMKQLIKPAKEGTQNVLDTATRMPSVKRVVVTSSVAAIMGDAKEGGALPNKTFTDKHWNTSSTVNHRPYAFSKTVAEKTAWKIAKDQSQWDLVTINPGFVFGPSLSKRSDSTSVNFVMDLANGKFLFALPEMYSSIVDVRDVSLLHVLAMENPQASGRYIGVAAVETFFQIGQILKREIGGGYKWPAMQAPKWLAKLVGPLFGQSRKEIENNVGFPYQFDHSRSRELGLSYRPVEELGLRNLEQLIADGLVPDKR